MLGSHGDASHHTFSMTLKELKRGYMTDVRDYGIALEYVKAIIRSYGCRVV